MGENGQELLVVVGFSVIVSGIFWRKLLRDGMVQRGGERVGGAHRIFLARLCLEKVNARRFLCDP